MNKKDIFMEYKQKFDSIIKHYKDTDENAKNIYNDIKKLESVHHTYITSDEIETSMNYSTYVDDIRHQIEIITKEYNYIIDVYNMNTTKLYRDLFKLYCRITKILISVYKDNKEIVIKIWNATDKIESNSPKLKRAKKNIRFIAENARGINIISEHKIFDEIKKSHYTDIRIYNELDDDNGFDLNDSLNIYNHVEKRLDELILSEELIKLSLLDIQIKTKKGLLGQTFLMDLNGKLDRIKVDYSIILKLLESMLNIHLSYATKYCELSEKISNEVSYDEDSLKNTSDSSDTNLSGNITPEKLIARLSFNNKSLSLTPHKIETTNNKKSILSDMLTTSPKSTNSLRTNKSTKSTKSTKSNKSTKSEEKQLNKLENVENIEKIEKISHNNEDIDNEEDEYKDEDTDDKDADYNDEEDINSHNKSTISDADEEDKINVTNDV